MESNYKNVLMWTCGSTKLNQKMDWAAEFSLVEDAAEEMVLDEKNAAAPIIWEGTIKGYKDTCVDVYSPEGHSEGLQKKGTNIVTWPCHGGENQQWYYRS